MPWAAYCCLRYIETLPSEAPLYRSFAGALQSPSIEAPPISKKKIKCAYVCMYVAGPLYRSFAKIAKRLCHIHTHTCTFQSFLLLTLSCSQDILSNNDDLQTYRGLIYKSMRHATYNVIITITIDVVLILFIGIGYMHMCV